MTRVLGTILLFIAVGLLGVRPARADTDIHAVGRVVYQNPRGELVGVDSIPVELWETANGVDICLDGAIGGPATTDQNGYFDFTRTYSPGVFCDDEPDIKLRVYFVHFETAMVPNFLGGTLDFGDVRPASAETNNQLFVYTVQKRAQRWFDEHAGTFFFPSPLQSEPHSYFLAGLSHQSIAPADAWNESIVLRILAEEWLNYFSTYYLYPTCNGVCDGATYGGVSCGTCLWCPENQTEALEVGFAAWAADEILSEFPSRYGVTPLATEDIEVTQDCAVTPQTQWETAGLFAAALRDISDSTNENDPSRPAGWDDMAVGPNAILTIFMNNAMSTPGAFFDAFKATYPGQCSELSLTALNNGFVIDGTPPAVVTNLGSSSHTAGGLSTDNTVDLTWTRPVDDCELASRFSIRWGSSPALPDAVAEVTDASTYTTPILPAGTWYFTIRSGDAVGNWNGSYDTFGPVTIVPPGPANLTHVLQSGWAYRVVPRPAGDASSGNVAFPTSLTGDAAATWWNGSVGNTGGGTAASTGLWVQADGIGFYNPFDPVDHAAAIPTLGVGATYEALNLGPITVRGGRHTFGAFNDFTGLVAESNENDNYWATQWIWSPTLLPVLGSTFRAAPPARMGGFDGSIATYWFNCDGVRFQATGTGAQWWNAATLTASTHDADYDLRLHALSTGPGNGFAVTAASSNRPADCLDAVIANRNIEGNDWDLGVVQATDTPSQAGYEIRHVTSYLETYNTSRSFTFPANEWMSLHEVYVSSSDLGPVSFVVRDDNGDDTPFHISWLNSGFTTGGMDDYSATAASVDGVARLDVTVEYEGYNCVVVYRDPKDGPANARDLTISSGLTPPDLVPGSLAGWAGPLVVRPAADGTVSNVPDPTFLPGWTASSYYNVLIANAGPTTAPAPFAIDLDLDGVDVAPLSAPGDLTAFNTIYGNDIGPFYVRGGRHTAAMRIDWPDDVTEISETNNHTSWQWAWSPQALAMGPTTALPGPGDPFGSWEYLDWSYPAGIFSNCDGYRTPTFDPGGADGMWGGVAVMPGDTTDVTLRLHGILNDVNNSFGESLTLSDFPTGEIDFSLLDFAIAGHGPYDVGVSGGYGEQDFTAEVVSSTYLGSNPTGTFGTFHLAANEMLNLHEVEFQAGFYHIRVENLTSGADLGFSIHPPGVGVMSRIDAVFGGAAWSQVAGEDEQVTVEIPMTGLYCIAVWKAKTPSLGVASDYNLVFDQVTAVPDVPEAMTNLVRAYPNPFAARTLIAFDLPEPGPVTLDVFDLQGSRVRRLMGENEDAGRHEVPWDGKDGTGRPVASGIYLVRLEAAGASRVTRIALTR